MARHTHIASSALLADCRCPLRSVDSLKCTVSADFDSIISGKSTLLHVEDDIRVRRVDTPRQFTWRLSALAQLLLRTKSISLSITHLILAFVCETATAIVGTGVASYGSFYKFHHYHSATADVTSFSVCFRRNLTSHWCSLPVRNCVHLGHCGIFTRGLAMHTRQLDLLDIYAGSCVQSLSSLLCASVVLSPIMLYMDVLEIVTVNAVNCDKHGKSPDYIANINTAREILRRDLVKLGWLALFLSSDIPFRVRSRSRCAGQ